MKPSLRRPGDRSKAMALNIGNVRGHDNSQTDTFSFDHVKFGGHEDINIGNVRGHDNSQTDTFVFDHVKFGGHEDINIGNVLGDDNSQTDTFIFEHVNFGGKGGGSGDLNIEFGGHDINIGN